MKTFVVEVIGMIFVFVIFLLLPPIPIRAAWNCLAPLFDAPAIDQWQALSVWFFVTLARWFVRSCRGVSK